MKSHLKTITAANRKHNALQDASKSLREQHEKDESRLSELQANGTDADDAELFSLTTKCAAFPHRIEAADASAEEGRQECVAAAAEGLNSLIPFLNAKEDALREKAIDAVLPFCINREDAVGVVDTLASVMESNHRSRNLEYALTGRDRAGNAGAINAILVLLKEAIAAGETTPARKPVLA
jgi:hypothetical protein